MELQRVVKPVRASSEGRGRGRLGGNSGQQRRANNKVRLSTITRDCRRLCRISCRALDHLIISVALAAFPIFSGGIAYWEAVVARFAANYELRRW
ncbi:hypothetical protein PI125_g11419 [Phytophthora idaei]|nr:hypothetical protein PI125_g11419 [Phytophthora idaei]KAG3152020.1 hypothetical protein PI126_g10726 [Phytophthora idaei]